MAANRTPTGLIAAMPVEAILGVPLRAMIDASAAATASYIRWFREVCLDKDGRVRQLEFDANDMRISLPIPAAVDHPNFAPDSIRMDVSCEVHASATRQVDTSTELSFAAKLGADFGIASASVGISVKTASASRSVRKTDTTSRMTMSATGSRRRLPEGMARTLDTVREIGMRPIPGASPKAE